MTTVEKIAKWAWTIILAVFSAYMTINVSIGVLKSDVALLQANASIRTSREFERDMRILNALGDLKGELGGVRTEVRLLKEEVRRDH